MNVEMNTGDATSTAPAVTTSHLARPGGRIGYDVAGSGPLVVLVPGMGDLRAGYRFLAPALRAAGYRVACTDLRGHGDSDPTFPSYGDDETADDVAALIAELGGPAIVVGNSMGAGSAVLAAARRAELVIARLEPWSVMKFSFLMSLVAWVVLFVAVAFLYFMLSSLGVFTSIQHTLTSVTSSSGSSGASLGHWFSASRVLGYTMLLGAVNIVLITALSTVGAMIYNLVTHLGGGIEVTLRETD